MTTKTDELKPCPFCGEAAFFERYGTNRQSCVVACGSCGCSMETGETGHNCGGMWNDRAALQSQDREDAERRQIADLVLHHAEGMQVSSPLESRQGFGEDTEHYFQISDGKIRYGVIITITRLTDIDHTRRIEGET